MRIIQNFFLDVDGISAVFNFDVFFNWLNQVNINESEIVVLIIIIHTLTLKELEL